MTPRHKINLWGPAPLGLNVKTVYAWWILRYQGSWGQYGAHLGPIGPRWAPCWPPEPCYQGWRIFMLSFWYSSMPMIRHATSAMAIVICKTLKNHMYLLLVIFCSTPTKKYPIPECFNVHKLKSIIIHNHISATTRLQTIQWKSQPSLRISFHFNFRFVDINVFGKACIN